MSDKHVYCTNCSYFRLCDESKPYCIFENKCDINDYGDSKPISERPYYDSNDDGFEKVMEIIDTFSAHGELYKKMKGKYIIKEICL